MIAPNFNCGQGRSTLLYSHCYCEVEFIGPKIYNPRKGYSNSMMTFMGMAAIMGANSRWF